MTWVGAAYLIVLGLSTILGMALVGVALRRRDLPGGAPLVAIICCMLVRCAAYLIELLAADADKLLWYNLRQAGVVALPLAVLTLGYEVYRQKIWTHWRLTALLSIVPLITLLLGFVDLPLVREFTTIDTVFGLRVIVTQRGPWIAISTVYFYFIYTIALVLLIESVRSALPGHRTQVGMLVVGLLVILTGNLMDLLAANPISPLRSGVLLFIPATVIFMYGLYRYQQLGMLPVAREHVFDAIADAVIVVDFAGRVLDSNQSARRVFGPLWSGERMIGLSIMDIVREWPEFQEQLESGAAKFDVAYPEYLGQTTFEVDVTQLADVRGHPAGRVLLVNDVTAQRAAFNLIAERERILVLQRFIRDASHDLRTPMSVLQSSAYLTRRLADRQVATLAGLHPKLPAIYAGVIEEAIDLSGKMRDRAVASDDAAKRLWSILSAMIELSELDTSNVLERDNIDLNELVSTIVKARVEDAERRTVALSTELAEALPPVYADRQRLKRAVDALVLNALQFNREGGKVVVRTYRDGPSVVMEVADTGIGISPADQPKVYDRFFRVDRARSTESGGAGIGLSLAKAIIDRHGGAIELESELGVGSTFKFKLPAVIVPELETTPA